MIPRTLATKLAAILLATLITLLSPGCAPSELQVQATTASAIAVVANVELLDLGKAFDADLVTAIHQAALDEDAAASAEHRTPARMPAMNAAQAVVEARWIPIWGDASHLGAWSTFRALHTTWAAQIEAGDAKAALGPRVNAAYCDLLLAIPPKYRARIAIPLIACPALSTKEAP